MHDDDHDDNHGDDHDDDHHHQDDNVDHKHSIYSQEHWSPKVSVCQ